MTRVIAMEGDAGYWILRDDGSLRSFGGAPRLEVEVEPFEHPAVSMAVAGAGDGVWILDAAGAVHAHGTAVPVDASASTAEAPAVALAATRDGDGLWIVDAEGTVRAHGSATDVEPTSDHPVAPVVGITTSPIGTGYWLLDAAGRVTCFGDAPSNGSIENRDAAAVELAALPDGSGYWIVREDGAVFSFGEAMFLGWMRGIARVQAIGIQSNDTGTGYWICGRRGEVLPFGDATYYGESTDPPLAAAIRAFPRHPDARLPRAPRAQAAVRRALGEQWDERVRAEAEDRAVRLPATDAPDVSIVVPAYGNDHLTYRCLAAIRRTVPTSIPYEVIVVDDASPTPIEDALEDVSGCTVLRNDENLGYLRSCNVGAAAARGPFLVMLNNDTEPQPGWLAAMLRTVRSDDRIGIVGAKLLDGDGYISEAGAIMWRDGTAWNVGRGTPKDLAEYSWVRDVDYASAACLLVRRELWEATGGFDERFVPAYYEDADLAFAARELGYRVVYQPRAEIVHLEGSTHGVDEGVGLKRHQATNRARFVDKWRRQLVDQEPYDERNVLRAFSRRKRPNALVVAPLLPAPDRDAGSARALEMLSALQRLGCSVSLAVEDSDLSSGYASRIQDRGIQVVGGPADLHRLLAAIGPELDLCILSHAEVAARFLPQVRELAPDASVVFDTVDLHFVRERRRAELTGRVESRKRAEAYEAIEIALAGACDVVATATDVDAEALERAVPCTTVVIPTTHPVQPSGPQFGERAGLLFVGGFYHQPNVDAVEWFVSEIMPRVRRHLPGARLRVAGQHPTEEIEALSADDVEILGWVPDLAPLYAASRLSVAPLRFGSGMKGKIGEALSFGLPVVTTTVGIEGTGLRNGHDVLVADDAEAFAEAVVRAYSGEGLWTALAANGRATAEERFSPAVVERTLERLFEDLGVPTNPDAA